MNPDQQYQDTQTWDVGTVLRHLKAIPTTKNAPLKDLKILNGYVNVFSFGPAWSNNLESQIAFVLSKPIKKLNQV